MKYKQLKKMAPSAVNAKEIQQVIDAVKEIGEMIFGEEGVEKITEYKTNESKVTVFQKKEKINDWLQYKDRKQKEYKDRK